MAAVNPGPDPVDVLIKRLDPELPLPARSHPGDAGVDLVAAVDVDLAPGERAVVPTGVAIALPDGYAAFVHPRSGLAAKHGVTIVNAPGTVDAGYRGEIRVTLLNTDPAAGRSGSSGATGSRSSSSSVWPRPVFHEVDSLPGSARGDGGFGSTGGHASAAPRAGAERGSPGQQDTPRREQGERKCSVGVAARKTEPEPVEDEAPDDAEDWAAADEDEADPEIEEPGRGRRQGPVGRQRRRPGRRAGRLRQPAGAGGGRVSRSSSTSPTIRARWIAVVHGDSSLQLQAFAAPKSGGLWDDVRQEIAAAVTKAGGEQRGGRRAVRRRSCMPGCPASRPGQAGLQPVRFLGVDGPRWFLRGVITGPAAERPAAAAPFEEVFADVGGGPRRSPGAAPRPAGDHGCPRRPGRPWRSRWPPEEEQRSASPLNPFERGPEITETQVAPGTRAGAAQLGRLA